MKPRELYAIFIILAGIILSFEAQGQDPQNRERKNQFYGGGGIGFSVSNLFSMFSASPFVGYHMNDHWSAGPRLTFTYIGLNGNALRSFGGGPFVAYKLSQQLFTYAEYEYLSLQAYPDGYSTTRVTASNSCFAGLGYATPLSYKSSLNVLALYNLLYGDGSKSAYPSPLLFRVNFVVGWYN